MLLRGRVFPARMPVTAVAIRRATTASGCTRPMMTSKHDDFAHSRHGRGAVTSFAKPSAAPTPQQLSPVRLSRDIYLKARTSSRNATPPKIVCLRLMPIYEYY